MVDSRYNGICREKNGKGNKESAGGVHERKGDGGNRIGGHF